jgi:seryl-tRNA synthetase
MIDLRRLREDPDLFKRGARDKGIDVDIERILRLDEQRRRLQTDMQDRRAEQNKLSKEIGPQIGKYRRELKDAQNAGDTRKVEALEAAIRELEHRPVALKTEVRAFENQIAELEPQIDELLMRVPLPPDPDVPIGAGPEQNVEIRRCNPSWFDPRKSFPENKGFQAKSHIDLMLEHGWVDFERAVKMSGTRHYVLRSEGMRLHQAALRFAFDAITSELGFIPMSVPVIVREECMIGTGFFPAGREQAYHIEETKRGGGNDLFMTGTGEVGLMGLHADEILDADMLPLRYATVSTCFRREAGAAGKDTAGLYRIHQFDKVEQVVICRADEQESRAWHRKMIEIVETLLQRLELPYRLMQCCTGDLGPKNADMIDIECWMPSRESYGETHSASRLYDYQCRRLKMRYKDAKGNIVHCHSLNNTVLASPRILIPMIEMYQNADGSVTVPQALRPYMGGRETIG